MNPIVYNKHGQFRFTDFVGYLPEFLRSEPDVVTFLQVMSDYINNAYRNVEVTDEFELVKVCSSTDSARVMRWMETLCGMFRLACDRGEKVMYLSVPRNNVKSNVVLGNANAEYVRTIEVDIDYVEDSFSSASSRMGGAGAVSDGDVVYVKYRKMSPVTTIAYYYVKDKDMLIRDDMGTSQDPFTGTYNDPSSAIEFQVTEVGHVVKRDGGKHGDIVFYEIYFPIKISNVGRSPTTGYIDFDVDGDNIDDSIYVDYYNLGNATSGSLNAYIRFADSGAFGWTGNYPGGMFYFRDSSAAGLTNLDTKDTMSIADTLQSPSVEKYRIKDIVKASGEYKIYTDVFPGIYANALFYVMRGTENLGVYRMNGDVDESTRFDEGTPYISVVNMSGVDYEIEKKDNLLLVAVPLAYSKYTLDYDSRLPLLKWTDEITEFDGISVGLSTDSVLAGVDLRENKVIYDGQIYRKASNVILLVGDCAEKFASIGYEGKGTILWDDGNTRKMVYVDNVKQIEGYTQVTILGDVTGNSAKLLDTSVGYVRTNESLASEEYAGGSITYLEIYNDRTICPIDTGDLLLIDFTIDDEIVTKLCEVILYSLKPMNNNTSLTTVIGIKTPEGTHVTIPDWTPITKIERNDAKVRSFMYVKKSGSDTTIGCVNERSYSGKIFTQKYMLATNTNGKYYSMLLMDTDVKDSVAGGVYNKGDYVYSSVDDTIYRIGQSVTVNEDGDIRVDNTAVPDYIVHYSLAYKKLVNDYMPYSGPVASLDYDETPNYDGNMSITRIPLYIKKINDVRLKYGWEQRQYVYYKDTIGVEGMDRSGFVDLYSGNDRSPVDVDLSVNANELMEPAMLSGCGSRYYTVDIDKEPVAVRGSDGVWTITIRSAGHGLPDGAVVQASVSNETGDSKVFVAQSVAIHVVSADIFQYTTEYPEVTGNVVTAGIDDVSIIHDKKYANNDNYPMDGDIAISGDKVYMVSAGEWKLVDKNAILTPATIYARQNLFDTSVTNPAFALSEDWVIKKITIDSDDPSVAHLQLSQRIPELDQDPSAYENKGRVFIRYVNQGVLNGWHTIKTVHNGGTIDIYIDSSASVEEPIVPISNRKMTLNVGRWYKYTLEEYDWDKISDNASFVTSNTVIAIDALNHRLTTKYAHKLKVGDHVLLDTTDGEEVYQITYETHPTHIYEAIVTDVVDDHTIELDEMPVNPDNDTHVVLVKGYIVPDVDNGGHNLNRLVGEYKTKINGETIRFTNGDVVIPLGQSCLDEIRSWRVAADTAWVPLKKKRTFKISRMSVDLEHNPAYELDDLENEVEYRYVTYSDADVNKDDDALLVDYANARNYHFEHPYVENLDTTQNVDMEYSSKYDYATVVPRDDMDATFHGVPDMDYPLAERIERLAYLRDPEVIDFDLIGYLARFMGYDITALADDIRSSNVYNNGDEREKAIRETIAHLPQFYALNGTKAGINMLMATFGLVGDLITMWTNTADPYGKLVRQDEVAELISKDTSSSWVPTPHVTLDVISNDVYNSVLMGNEELLRMKEQIRRCKPINVVFDGIRVIFESTAKVTASISFGGSSMTNGTIPLFSAEDYGEGNIDRDPCMDDDCGF